MLLYHYAYCATHNHKIGEDDENEDAVKEIALEYQINNPDCDVHIYSVNKFVQ